MVSAVRKGEIKCCGGSVGGRGPSIDGLGRASWRMWSLHAPWKKLKNDPEDANCKAKGTGPGNTVLFQY